MSRIYLAGKVPKSDNEDFLDFRISFIEKLSSLDSNYEFISPLDGRCDESDPFGIFGKDCDSIKNSDIVLVDASNKLGVGTSQEMVIAKYFGKIVITYLPRNTAHRKSNIVLTGKEIEDWIHPFVFSFSDAIIEDLEEFDRVLSSIRKVKDIKVIDEAIQYVNE